MKGHGPDFNRVVEDVSDNFGIEDRGSTREWNEEIQPFRDIDTKNVQEQVVKSKFVYKIISEFVDASRQLVLGVSDGHIAPFTYGEAESSEVYVYNGIFMSKAVDAQETFKVCAGDEACRKAATLDLKNQKLLLSHGIPGLSCTLMTVVDYKAERYIAQTVISGLLSMGSNSARLMYGALDHGQRLSVRLISCPCSQL